MKERILTGWTFHRAIYLLMGVFILTQAVLNQEWAFALFGGYFAAMGLFAFGCASGTCYNNIRTLEQHRESKAGYQNTELDKLTDKPVL